MNCYSITRESGKKLSDRMHTLSPHLGNSLPGKGLSKVKYETDFLWKVLYCQVKPCQAYQ